MILSSEHIAGQVSPVSEERFVVALRAFESRHWGTTFTGIRFVVWYGKTSSSDGLVFFAGAPKDTLSQPNDRHGRDRGGRIAVKITAYTYAFLVNRLLDRRQGHIKKLWA